MNGFQKILRVVDRHEKYDFSFFQFFLLRPFFDHFSKNKRSKNDRSKKVVKLKDHIFHARQPREGIFEIRS